MPGGGFADHVADVEAHCVQALGEFGTYEGAEVELEFLVGEEIGGVEVAQESSENPFEAILVPCRGELHEGVTIEVAEVQVRGCVDLGRSECLEQVVQDLVAFEVDCGVEEVSSRLVEMRLDEVEVDEELEAFEAVCCALVGHGILRVDLVVLQIGASELNGTADDNVISDGLQEILDVLVFDPGTDAVAESLAGGSHHMEGMDAGAGQMRMLRSNEEYPVQHLVEDVRGDGGEAEVVYPVVDRMLVGIVIVHTVKVPLRLLWRRDGEAKCSAHEDV